MKENWLEILLNKLIEKGWKPFEREKTLHIKIYDCDLNVYFDWWFMNEDKKSFRELVSKESWLWQFVCKNKIIEQWKTVHDYVISHITYSYDKGCWWYAPNNSEFWIMMSALCDEDKLEKFLLENIKVEWKNE